jgi:tetratricopeptide (TPR) repeat protein
MPVYETFTDLSGRFSFTGLRRGIYQLTAEGDDQTFETTRVNAEISAYGTAPQSFTQNIQLRLKTGKAVQAASVLSADLADPNLPAGARQEYEKGVRDARDNKAEKAMTHFKEAVTLYPAFYIAQVALAEQYSKLKRDADALATYEEAIKTKPDRAAAYVGLGILFVKQKNFSEALAPLRRSLEIDKQSATPYLYLGYSEMMIGDYKSSETNLLKAYEIGKPTVAHIYLANLYEQMREPEKAIEQLQSFLRENPDSSNSAQIREAIEKLKKKASKKD